MEGFVWRKGENYSLGASLTSPSKKGKGAKRGGAKLTFLFMEGFVWKKGEKYSVGVSLTSPLKKGKGAKRGGAKLPFFL